MNNIHVAAVGLIIILVLVAMLFIHWHHVRTYKPHQFWEDLRQLDQDYSRSVVHRPFVIDLPEQFPAERDRWRAEWLTREEYDKLLRDSLYAAEDQTTMIMTDWSHDPSNPKWNEITIHDALKYNQRLKDWDESND